MAPVGCYESLHAAINAGANSVYFGIGRLNMRSASAANFSEKDLEQIVEIAHKAGVKTYLTVNTIIYDDELQAMHEVVDKAKAVGVDAIIASDLAVITYAYHAGVEVHISTQCNISNSEAVKFFSQWADTVVLARELTLEQVAEIHREIIENDIRGPKGELVEIEMFAHGALCMSISGKCYLSLYETNCSANRGACRQLCRRKYTVRDKETGAALDIDGRYVLSPKDLCTIDFLDRFIQSGVKVLKIEGRARGAEYVKRVVESYDRALRLMESGEYNPTTAAALKERLSEVFNRGSGRATMQVVPLPSTASTTARPLRVARSMWVRWSTSTRRSRWPRCLWRLPRSRLRRRSSSSARRPVSWSRSAKSCMAPMVRVRAAWSRVSFVPSAPIR